ncbi:MAG: 7-carboxy-7-deazaguanine synthase QueE [Elusimicrobiota bacterium]
MGAKAREDRARIVEVYSSIQGEGLRLGERQIFVRLGGCNLRCDYCDEPGALGPASGRLWDRERLQGRIMALQSRRRHATISWTGGEPLLQAAFLRGMLVWARGRGFQNQLETNAVLPEALARVRGILDAVAVNIKLPSAVGRPLWSAHAEFLRAVPAGGFVKVVLTDASASEEWERVIRLMEENAPRLPLILQPATPVPSTRHAGRSVGTIPPERALAFLWAARFRLGEVRLIPQWHPVWGMR